MVVKQGRLRMRRDHGQGGTDWRRARGSRLPAHRSAA